MNKTVINIKTDPKIKIHAQKIAADLGLSLSGILNAYLKQLVRLKAVQFNLNNGEIPSGYLLSALKESERDRKNGDTHSFKTPKEAIAFLDK